MNFVKNYLKYVILGVVLAVITIVVGILNIKDVCYAEENKSSYTRTKFDFYIDAPSAGQVNSLSADASVSAVFPYYLFKNAFTGNKAKEIGVVVFDDDKNADISLLSDGTLAKGKYDSDGVMMDLTAAELLGVKVGDKLDVTVLGVKYSKTVSALYLASTYPGLAQGLIMVKASNELKQKINENPLYKLSYSGALLSSNDRLATSGLLKNYVGEGHVQSYDDYAEIHFKNKHKPSGMTDEEFAAQNLAEYEAYRAATVAEYLKAGTQVADKANQYLLVKDKIQTAEKKIDTMIILTSVAVFVLFIVVGVVFIVTNKRNDRIRCDEGMPFGRMAGGYILVAAITAVATALVTLIALIITASGTYFFPSCLTTLLAFTFSPIAALPFVAGAALIYTRLLYSSSAEL